MNDYLKKRQEHIFNNRPLREKKKYVISKVSEKRKQKLAEQKEEGSDNKLDLWFEERRKEMTGVCAECGGKTGKHDDKFYRHSICHILPKRDNMFPSISTHDLNWIELCFWGNSCHSKYDSSFEKAAQMRIWPYVCKRLNILYPLLTREEKAKLPDIIVQEILPEKYNQ